MSIGKRLDTTPTQDILILAGVGIGIFVVYKVIQGVKAVAGAVGEAGAAVYHGAQAVTAPVSSGIASAIISLTQQPNMEVAGNVLFPDGYGAPLSLMAVFTDQAGNVYVKDRGSTWQLHPSDADGDWPATYVSG